MRSYAEAPLIDVSRAATRYPLTFRSTMSSASCSDTFSNSSVTLVHGMSRPIGAHFHVAHGLSNAMLFPAVTAFSVSGAVQRYAECARAYGVADPTTSDEIAAGRIVDALAELCDDLEVPTPKSYGIDHDTWTRLTPLMAQQAIASGSPANNPVLPSHDDIERIYADVYGSGRSS